MARRPIREGLFEFDGDSVELVGGFSPSSGRHHFPKAPLCPYSGADDIEEVHLSRRGTLWAWTAVNAAPPGYDGPVPYGFGVVELPEGLRVISRLTEADPSRLREGQTMETIVVVVGSDDAGDDVVTWAFAPVEGVDA